MLKALEVFCGVVIFFGEMMRIVFTSVLLFIAQFSLSAALPDLTCQEVTNETIMLNPWLVVPHSKTKNFYKFKNRFLFVSSVEREEYLYGKVEEVELRRYQSGYKTIVFSAKDFTAATISHHDQTSVVISKVQCSKI